MRRFPVSRRVIAAAAVAVLTGSLAAGCGSVKPPPSSLGVSVNQPVPASIANIPLTEPDGRTTDLAAFRGKTVMIADFLSLCTDICPLISANTAALARALNADGEGSKVALLEISVDPQRDTPARLAAYQKLYGGPLPDWTLLRTSPANTARLWKYFRVAYGRTKEPNPPAIDWWTHKPLTYDVYHSDDLIFLNADGDQRFVVNADPEVAAANVPPSKLVKFLDPQGVRALYKPNPIADWTVGQALSVFSWLLNHKLALPA